MLNFYQKEERLQKALDEGIDGIEAYSNYHEAKHNRYYDTYCRRHGVLMTCGSDFHGKMKPKFEWENTAMRRMTVRTSCRLF